jgi:hypothetical protein
MVWNDIEEVEIKFSNSKKIILKLDKSKLRIIQSQLSTIVNLDEVPFGMVKTEELPMRFNLHGIIKSIFVPYTFKERLLNKLTFWRQV